MFTDFSMLLDETEVHGAARFCLMKVFSQLYGEEFWKYQAGKQLNTMIIHFINRDFLGRFFSYWALPGSKDRHTLNKGRPEHSLLFRSTCLSHSFILSHITP